jgi:excisionase family DNA binding protein
MQELEPPKLFSLSLAAERLGVSTCTLRRLIASGHIRSVNIGARRLVASSELERVAALGAGQPRTSKETSH